VLRLPPYHCIFNPIELIWGIAKNYYNRHIGRDGNTEKDCLDMWREALQTVTPEMWKNSIRHTEDEIVKWYEREKVMDRQEVLPLIINVDDYSSESSDYDSNSH
jgi:transposase